jgi:tetratricopeptide (TPR) repeat protein
MMKAKHPVIKVIGVVNNKLLSGLGWATSLGRPQSKVRDAHSLHLQAIKLHREKQYDEALHLYNQALEFSAFEPSILHNRGLLLQTVGRHDEALADFARVMFVRERLQPAHPATINYRGRFYNIAERYEDAVAEFNRTLLLYKENAEALYNRAISFSRLDLHEDALDDLNRAALVTPDKLDILDLRATINYNLGHFVQAISDFTRILELYPEDSDNSSRRQFIAHAYKKASRFEEALAAYNALIETDADNAAYRIDRAYSLFQLKRFAAALADYSWAIEHQAAPSSDLHYNLGATYSRLEQYEEALVEYARSLELQPDNPTVHAGRGAMLYELGRLDEARDACDATLLIQGDNANALAVRAIIKARLGQLEEGKGDFVKARGIAPNESAVRYASAALCSIFGDTEGAMAILADLVHDLPEVRKGIGRDPAFANLHALPSWKELLDEQPA